MNRKISGLLPEIYSRFSIKYLIITVMTITMLSCKAKTIESQWNRAGIKIDGDISDWQSSNTFFDENLNMVYSICNNYRDLNIFIRFQDKHLARRMLTQGFTIWLDKKRTKGVRYFDYIAHDRVIDRLMEGREHGPGQQMHPPEKEKINWLSGTFYLIEGELEKKLTEKDSLSIQAAAGEENTYFCLEYRINFSTSTDEKVLLSLNGKNKFKAALEISGLPEDVREQLEQRFRKGPGMDGGMPGGGGMRGRGAPPGGMGAPGTGKFDPMKQFEEQVLWLEIKLVQEK
jgi:hypothetical protein